MNQKDDSAWAEAQRRCGLSDEEVRMAKELGFHAQVPHQEHSLAVPAMEGASWREWVRDLYEKKIGSRKQAGRAPATPAVPNQVIEFRNPEHPWPDKPEIPELVSVRPIRVEGDEDEDVNAAWDKYAFQDSFGPPEEPSEEDIDRRTPGGFAASACSAGQHSRSR